MVTNARLAKKRNVTGWLVFLAVLLVLSFAAMPGFEKYSSVADRVLIAVRLTLVLALSVLVVRERWPNSSRAKESGTLLQRCRRWFYDE